MTYLVRHRSSQVKWGLSYTDTTKVSKMHNNTVKMRK